MYNENLLGFVITAQCGNHSRSLLQNFKVLAGDENHRANDDADEYYDNAYI